MYLNSYILSFRLINLIENRTSSIVSHFIKKTIAKNVVFTSLLGQGNMISNTRIHRLRGASNGFFYKKLCKNMEVLNPQTHRIQFVRLEFPANMYDASYKIWINNKFVNKAVNENVLTFHINLKLNDNWFNIILIMTRVKMFG